MSASDINTTNARAIDNINHVPCGNNNIECNIYDTCAINYDIITLNKNNHQKHAVEPIPLSNKQNMTTLSKLAKTQELLIKEASDMENLMNNAIEMEQLVHDTSITLQTKNPGNEILISVMIPGMKQVVERPKPASSSSNDTLTKNISHNTHKVRQYKYTSNLNGSKWSTKALKTKTDVHMRRTSIPGESAAPHIREESNISFTKSKRNHDPTNSNSVLYLPISTNGELEKFRVMNRDNDHGNDANYQQNGEYWKSHRIIGHKKVDRYHNPYNVIIEWGNGEISEIPLKLFEQDAPDECALYAKENHLLDEPGWKQYRNDGEHHQPRNGNNDE